MERVSSYVTWLEDPLSNIRIEHPQRVTEQEAQCHLWDKYFHGMWKHLQDSLHYLYDNHTITYSQLTVAARKAELEYNPKQEPYSEIHMKSSTADQNGTDQKECDYDPNPEF